MRCNAEMGGLESKTWLESDSSRQFCDLWLAWPTLTKDLTWLWLAPSWLVTWLDLSHVTCQVIAVLLNILNNNNKKNIRWTLFYCARVLLTCNLATRPLPRNVTFLHESSEWSSAEMEGAPTNIPKIIHFGYKEYTTTQNKRGATCKICNVKITDLPSTTSNFIRHFRTAHKERWVTCCKPRWINVLDCHFATWLLTLVGVLVG